MTLLALSSCDFNIKSHSNIETISNRDEYDWTPEEFKKQHYEEWLVVKPAINIQQKQDVAIDFAAIDTLIREYINRNSIKLADNKFEEIVQIEQICKTKFNIQDYDDSNMGMFIADGTRRLFDMYVNWLYQQEAEAYINIAPCIDFDKEFELYTQLNDAVYDICDSVCFKMGGSGAWITSSGIHDIEIDYHRSIYLSVIGAKLPERKTLDVPLELFDKECKMLADGYVPLDEDVMPAIDPYSLVNRYRSAFYEWYNYRQAQANTISDAKIKADYEVVTYSFARKHFLHLKNRFNDIGMMNDEMLEICLNDSCSNQELLEFNYEVKQEEVYSSSKL